MAGDGRIRIWTGSAATAPPEYPYGGWAWLALHDGTARGAVGGERDTTVERMALRALIEALKAVADRPGAPVEVDPGDPVLASYGIAHTPNGLIGAPDAAALHPGLWKELAGVSAKRRQSCIFRTAPGTAEPRRFVDAWTAFALDRCKTRGAFASAIPKPNLQTLLTKKVGA